ncbi:hypothetical protein RSO67_02390 [Tardiphaga sp. 709]|nr:hypothetical protein [Tardiphaga sp. 709]WNV10065.1 hypothetical protein RSO67_02390 [Tardiphaga sp. 709]
MTRRIVSGIIFIIRNGLRWRHASAAYGVEDDLQSVYRLEPIACSTRFAALAERSGKPDQLMIDASHLKAHRTAANVSDAPRAV